MEVNFKPVRMIQADVTDPKTGEERHRKSSYWYLAYRALIRNSSGISDSGKPEELARSSFPDFLFVVESRRGIDENTKTGFCRPPRQRSTSANASMYKKLGANRCAAPENHPRPFPRLDVAQRASAMWTASTPKSCSSRFTWRAFLEPVTRSKQGPKWRGDRHAADAGAKFWAARDRFDQNEEENPASRTIPTD